MKRARLLLSLLALSLAAACTGPDTITAPVDHEAQFDEGKTAGSGG